MSHSEETAKSGEQQTISNLREIINPTDFSTWDLAWKMGVTPWDAGEIQPPLREALQIISAQLPKTGRALVPGCGAGYDVPFIAATTGLDVTGLDISEIAATKARKLIEDFPSPVHALIEVDNFFEFHKADGQVFDLIYDHTFFSAIHPSTRDDWAAHMAHLLKPGGFFITLVFPIDPYVEGGPPFYLRPEHYQKLLESNFEKVVDKVPDESTDRHKGREHLMVWRRK